MTTSVKLFEPHGSLSGSTSESLADIFKNYQPGKAKKATSASSPGDAFTAPESSTNAETSTSAPASVSSAAAPAAPAKAAETRESTTDKFTNLKGKINHDLYKALTQRPFNFEKMSSVQQAVLNLLPELAKTPASATEGEQAENTRPDLLVKAKTGTGKTVAFLVPALEARFNDIEREQRSFVKANPKYVPLANMPLMNYHVD